MNQINLFKSIVLIGISIFFLFMIVKNQASLYRWKSVNENFLYRDYELKNYQNLSFQLENSGFFFFDYTQKLIALGKLREANSVLKNEVLTRRTTIKLLILRGDVQLSLNDTINAIENYKRACFIVPHSLTSKYRLMKTNLELKDTIEGYFWANSILHERVKIRSPASDSIQKEVIHFLTKK